MSLTTYSRHLSNKVTPQSEAIPGTNQVKNNAGGFSFVVDDWTRLERFLIIGSAGGTYYASERKLTRENAEVVQRCMLVDYKKTVDMITDVSVNNRAPKNDPAIFALALAASVQVPGNPNLQIEARKYALSKLNAVCRTGTHLFQFVSAVHELRDWSAGLRRAVGNWYTNKEAGKLAYQVTKYAQREGWSHRDVLRLTHVPKPPSMGHEAIFRYVTAGGVESFGERKVLRKNANHETTYPPILGVPDYLMAVEQVKQANNEDGVVKLIKEYDLPREVIPTQFLNSPKVWETLLTSGGGMPLTAMIRNLGKMTSIGLVSPLSDAEKHIVGALGRDDYLKNARVHPITILNALKQYGAGHGDKGSLTWKPSNLILSALNRAFYASFKHVIPSGKRFFLGIDVSGSMSYSAIGGMSLSCCEAATALAMVIQKTEPWTFVGAFETRFQEIPIHGCSTLEEAMKYTKDRNFGGTDCSLPMVYARENNIQADVFVVLTDNETWAGHIHPSQALRKYRDKTGIPARLAVFGMTATEFTIADPNDAGMLDFTGFDSAAPQLLTEFARA